MENKIKVIDEIVKRHPAYGVDKGWGHYTGGMKDSGVWYYRKMIDVPIDELEMFLAVIITDESKPKIDQKNETNDVVWVEFTDPFGRLQKYWFLKSEMEAIDGFQDEIDGKMLKS